MADVLHLGNSGQNGEQPATGIKWWKSFWNITYIAAFILSCFIGFRLLPEGAVTVAAVSQAVEKLIPFIAILFGSLVFVRIYTRPIADQDQAAGAPRSWFVFAYAFMVAALILAILPFVATVHTNRARLAAEPISVLLGCVQDQDNLLPKELQCGPLAKGQPAAGAATGHVQWILNVGGSVSPQEDCGPGCSVVRGGLAVPLYVVILALVGGAISLTRRVPEYQKQAAPNYTQTEADKPKLDLPVVREFLVFQIVQYLSAPLIAVTAYYAIKPTDTASSVALAFVSGFASEPILVMIRGIIDKVTPTLAKAAPLGSVSVHVAKATAAVPDAEVSIVGQPALTAKLDENKRYVIDAVPVGEHAIEVKSGNDTKTVKVHVSAGKVATCEVDLAA